MTTAETIHHEGSRLGMICSYCPHEFDSKTETEETFGALEWKYEFPKRNFGIASTFNHDGRWLGTNNPLGIAVAVVYERPQPTQVYDPTTKGE